MSSSATVVDSNPSQQGVCANCQQTKAQLGNHPLKRCLQCGHTWYCSRACQRSHWPKHKPKCMRVAKLLDSRERERKVNKLFGNSGFSGALFTFGAEQSGLLGNGCDTDAGRHQPQLVEALKSIPVVRADYGLSHALVTTQDGRTFTFGENEFGQLGLATKADTLKPSYLGALDTKIVSSSACGMSHSCVVTSEGQMFSFGNGELGRLGLSERSRATQALPSGVPRWDSSDRDRPKLCRQLWSDRVLVTEVACGEEHTLALSTTGRIYAMGNASRGALGLGKSNVINYFVPTVLSSLAEVPIVGIAAGAHHSLAVSASGSLFSWGRGAHGATGHGNADTVFSPKVVRGVNGAFHATVHVVKVSAGEQFSAAVSLDGNVFMFGQNKCGQLGVGDYTDFFTPALIDPKHFKQQTITMISCGSSHVLAASETTVFAWGSNNMGQLGNPNFVDHTTPVAVEYDFTEPLLLNRVTPANPETESDSTRTTVRIVYVSAGSDVSAVIATLVNTRIVSNLMESKDLASPRSAKLKRDVDAILSEPSDAKDGDMLYEVIPHPGSGVSLKAQKTAADLDAHGNKHSDEDVIGPVLPSSSSVVIEEIVDNKGDDAGRIEPRPEVKNEMKSDSLADKCAEEVENLGIEDAPGEISDDEPPTQNVNALIQTKHKVAKRAIPPASFDYQAFLHTVRLARLTNNYQPLADYVGTVFSSPSSLNASFFNSSPPSFFGKQILFLTPPDNDGTDHQKALEEWAEYQIGVDASMVERFYRIIISINQAPVTNALLLATQKALRTLTAYVRSGSHHLMDLCSLRSIPIILQNPLLNMRSERNDLLVEDVCRLVAFLPVDGRQQLRQWFTDYPTDIISVRVVKMLTKYIGWTLRLPPRPANLPPDVALVHHPAQIPPRTQLAVGLLLLVHDANKRRAAFTPHRFLPAKPLESPDYEDTQAQSHSQREAIPADFFYIKDLMSKVDLAQDYLIWSRYIQEFGSNPNIRLHPPPFSFCWYSFLLDPVTKGQILRLEHKLTSMLTQVMSGGPIMPFQVRRDALLEDTLDILQGVHPSFLKRQLYVQFIGEEGIDQGGVQQEYFSKIISILVDPETGLFKYNPEQRTHWFNDDAGIDKDPKRMNLFRVAGIICGAAFFHGITIGVQFPEVFFKRLLNLPCTLEDLDNLEPMLGRSLHALLDYDGDDVEDLFCLNFTVERSTEESSESKNDTVELKPGGANIAVTNANRTEYVNAYVKYRLEESVKAQSETFYKAFRDVCDGTALRNLQFTTSELEVILCGQPTLDFKALESSSRCEGYTKEHRLIKDFWSIVHDDLTPEQQRQLLIFITGSARSPVGGLGALRITLQRASGDSEAVPTSHVCFHTMLIPEYPTREKLKKKLLVALTHCEGFGLQ